MLAKRIIPCLDIKDGRIVKGVNFVNLRDAGDPVEQARLYNEQGADELVLLDISATHEGRKTTLELVSRVAETVFMPLTVGGGVGDVVDIRNLLSAGADKVSVNSAAVMRPELLSEGALRFGAQCIVLAIDARPRTRFELGSLCQWRTRRDRYRRGEVGSAWRGIGRGRNPVDKHGRRRNTRRL